MKATVRLPFYGALVLSLLLLAITFLQPNFSEEEGEGEEEEGIPGIMRAMDLWSDMRSYPFEKMRAADYTKSFFKARTMTLQDHMRESGELAVSTNPWSALGPMNFAGRILCVGFHPTNANIMWVGSASGGLWKTTTGGTGAANGINWQYVSTGFPVIGVASIAVHPTDPNIIYIGTGEVYNNGAPATGATGAGHIRTYRGSYGIGILKTTDGGATWTKSLDFARSNLKGVSDLLIDPSNNSIVYAATTDGVYRTTDAGANWTLIHTVPMAMDICFKPNNSAVLYVGCGNLGSTGTGIYKSTNANAGTPAFTAINSGLPAVISGKIQMHISAASPTTVFASIGRDPNTSDAFGLYVTTNEGTSWTQRVSASTVMGANSSLNQGWYAHDVVVDPANINTIYWAEMDLYKTTDGSTFARRSVWSSWDVNSVTVGDLNEGTNVNYVHADIHRLYISPFSSSTLFLCTDGGLFKSSNATTSSFVGLNGGLMTAQIYANMSISKQDPNFMIGGLQDNEGFVYSGSTGCRRIPSLGDGFHSAINPRDDDTCYIASYYLNMKRSVNRGSTFATMSSAAVALGNPPTETVCFNAPYVIAPSNPNIMYAGSYRVKKTTDRGSTWSNMGGALSNTSTPLIYIAVAPTDPNTAYFSVAPGGGARSKLFKTTNGGTSYTEITGTLPDRYYSYISVDPVDPNRLAVTLSGFDASHVYLSNNGGTSWSDISTGLGNVPHNVVKFNPNNRNNLYVGNDLGVFYAYGVPTSALGATTNLIWTSYNEGLGDAVLVSDILFTSTNKLRLATYGKGLWDRDLAPVSTLPSTFKSFEVQVTGQGNQLRWSVSDETHVKEYEIEYSTDATTFKKVAIAFAENTSGEKKYTYLHPIINTVNGYYRIKTIDIDGSFTFSSVKEVKAVKPGAKLVVYPNPTTGPCTVTLPGNVAGNIEIKAYDNSGRLMLLERFNIQPGTRNISINVSRLAAGNYQLVCENDKLRWTTRILKK